MNKIKKGILILKIKVKAKINSFFDFFYNKKLANIQKRPLKNIIVFECESDMDDNPRAIYEYMIAQRLNRQYKMVWIVQDVKFCRKNYKQKNVFFISRFDSSRKNQLKLHYYLSTAKYCLFSHPYWYVKKKEEQVVIHTGHGTPLKNRGKEDKPIDHTFDKMLVTSEGTKDLYLRFWQCPEAKAFICGNPRNDFLFNPKRDEIISKLFKCSDEDKIVMCMPTYRKSSSRNDCDTEDRFALGVINTEEEFQKLNQYLKENKMHIIVKLHPLQVLDRQYLNSVSNIHYIVNRELFEKKILLYELLGCCDALLTDFSSVFFDYLILNRPIGFFMKDFDKYRRGFIMENPLDFMVGEKMISKNDFYCFLDNLKTREDKGSESRQYISELVNFSNKPNNGERFVKKMFGDF